MLRPLRLPRTGASVLAAGLSLAVSASPAAAATATPTLLEPSAHVRTSSPVKVRFALPEKAAPGSVVLSFSGAHSVVLQLDSTMESKATHELQIETANPIASGHVTAVLPTGATILDGTYTVAITYSNEAHEPAASALAEGVGLDTVTEPPTLSAPTAGSEQTGPFNVVFSQPEEGFVSIPGSTELAFTGPSTSTLALATVIPGEHTVAIDPANLAQAGTVTAGPAALANGSYTLRVGYRDILGNPAAFSGTLAFKLNVPAPKTEPASSPAPTPAATPPAPPLAAQLASAAPAPKRLAVRWSAHSAGHAGARTLTATFAPVTGATRYSLTVKLGRTARSGSCRVEHRRRTVACSARVPGKGRWSATASALGSSGTLALAAKTVRFR